MRNQEEFSEEKTKREIEDEIRNANQLGYLRKAMKDLSALEGTDEEKNKWLQLIEVIDSCQLMTEKLYQNVTEENIDQLLDLEKLPEIMGIRDSIRRIMLEEIEIMKKHK